MNDRYEHIDDPEIAEFLAPLAQPAPVKQSAAGLESLLAFAKELGPSVTLLSLISGFFIKVWGKITLGKLLSLGLVLIVAVTGGIQLIRHQSEVAQLANNGGEVSGILDGGGGQAGQNAGAAPKASATALGSITPVGTQIQPTALSALPEDTTVPLIGELASATEQPANRQPTATTDVLQSDSDGDGIPDSSDNCPFVYNPGQQDSDRDGVGDACEAVETLTVTSAPDTDGDGIPDGEDNCPFVYNPSQQDTDGDGVGDACEPANTPTPTTTPDTDGDGIPDSSDNCPNVYNPGQQDSDGDGIGDACDTVDTPTPTTVPDTDGDGIPDSIDNCPFVYNPDQQDTDGDGIGDACEPANTPTPVPNLVTVDIVDPTSGEKVTGVGKTKFHAVAFDELVGSSDGAGIVKVSFKLSGPQGVFHTSTDTAAPYCEFGGTGGCNSMGNPLWSTLVSGEYTLTVTAYSESGFTKVQVVKFIIQVN